MVMHCVCPASHTSVGLPEHEAVGWFLLGLECIVVKDNPSVLPCIVRYYMDMSE